jgi:polysaccharide biosynthesis/export protein
MKNRMRTLAIVVLLLSLPSVVCSQENKDPQISDLASSAEPANLHQLAAAVPADYRIGVSDVAAITVWKLPELSRSVPVRPDGKISLPLIGDIEASGKTTSELHDLIVARLKPYVPEPDVTVIVEQINSQKYFVIGKVTHPGSFPLTGPSSVVEALAAAGGFVDWAKTGDITVVRHTADNQTERIPFSYKDWLKKKSKKGSAIELKNGDIIVVP